MVGDDELTPVAYRVVCRACNGDWRERAEETERGYRISPPCTHCKSGVMSEEQLRAWQINREKRRERANPKGK